jgi:type IV pilus assembly protein PilF
VNFRHAMALLGISFIFAGCTQLPQQSTVTPLETGVSDTDTDLRSRARIRTQLAAGYFQAGNMGVALEEILTALRTDSTYSPAHDVAGLIYAALKDDRQAEDHFRQALQLNPVDPDANNNYGLFLCQRKRGDYGIKYFLAAVQNTLYSSPQRSYFNAGLCAKARGDIAAAQGYFSDALKSQPNYVQAIYQLADIAYARGDYAESRGYISRLLPVAARSAEILWLALRTERRLGAANAEASFAFQLRRNFPNSREAQALAAGRFE